VDGITVYESGIREVVRENPGRYDLVNSIYTLSMAFSASPSLERSLAVFGRLAQVRDVKSTTREVPRSLM